VVASVTIFPPTARAAWWRAGTLSTYLEFFINPEIAGFLRERADFSMDQIDEEKSCASPCQKFNPSGFTSTRS
jgi:hypothetical protein